MVHSDGLALWPGCIPALKAPGIDSWFTETLTRIKHCDELIDVLDWKGIVFEWAGLGKIVLGRIGCE